MTILETTAVSAVGQADERAIGKMMEKIRRLARYGRAGQFLIVAAIFLFSLLTFNILFDASSPDDYPRELLAALIGTILAAVVTTLLLNQQSAGEELKERNVEVFRKKIEAYETFIGRALLHAEDNELSDEEVRELRRAIYSMSLVSNADTVSILIGYVRANHVRDTECEISEVIGAFRKELRLDPLADETLTDLAAIESKLSGTLHQDQVQTILDGLDQTVSLIVDKIGSASAEIAKGVTTSDASGLQDGVCRSVYLPSGVSCTLSQSYDNQNSVVEGLIDLDALPAQTRHRLSALALTLGFEADDEMADTPMFTLRTAGTVPFASDENEAPALSVDDLARGLVALEQATQTKKR